MTPAASTITASELAKIEAALHVLVGAAIVADRTPDYRITPPRGPVSVGAAVREFLDALDKHTPAQREAAELLDNPVSEALRQAVRTLGRRLHEIGGHRLMVDVLDRVAARDPATEGRRIGLIDHRWSGIGDWMA